MPIVQWFGRIWVDEYVHSDPTLGLSCIEMSRGREVYFALQGSCAGVEGSPTQGDVPLLACTALEYLEWKTRMKILRVED
jgi:hypothetical protein